MTPAARLAASIELLTHIIDEKRPADAIANNFFRERRFIGSGDRRAISESVWGVLRTWYRIEWWLNFVKLSATPRMRMAVYGVLSGVSFRDMEHMFSGGKYAPHTLLKQEQTGLENLVGRTFTHPDMPLWVRCEVPEWLLPLFKARFEAHIEQELAAFMLPASLDLRVNTLKADRPQALQMLQNEGFSVEVGKLSPWAIRIKDRVSVTSSSAFQKGYVEIQDEGSQLIALLVGAKPGMRVLDFCAGAGGKTLAMAMMMENKGHMIACDVSAIRLEGAIKRLRRAGIGNVERHVLVDGDKWLKRRKESFDRVLVDAPCSGTGTWRRNPDGRLRLTQTDIDELVEKQRKILAKAAKMLKKGGILAYATCSVLEEENGKQVEHFLANHPDFSLLPLSLAEQAQILPETIKGKYLELSAAQYATDGFFCALLQKKADEAP